NRVLTTATRNLQQFGERAGVLLDRVVDFGRPPSHVLFESLHGAAKDADRATAAVGWRGAAFNVSATAVWQDAVGDQEHVTWACEAAAPRGPGRCGGPGYPTYMRPEEPIERVRAGFGEEASERLQELKPRLAPGNVLRRNQNIPPR